MMEFHINLRSFIVNGIDDGYGRFDITKRWNLDEVGIALRREVVTTVTEKGAHFVTAPLPKPGKPRRFATLVVCVKAMGDQPPVLHIILRGKGTSARLIEESESWDKTVKVHWQSNAWMTSDIFREVMSSGVVECDSLLFLDNLSSHRAADDILREKRITPWWGPPRLTDHWQPVDQSIGTTMGPNF